MRELKVSLSLLLTSTVLCAILSALGWGRQTSDIGSYWLSSILLLSSKNPYSLESMRLLGGELLNVHDYNPTMVVPWSLALFSPIGFLSFNYATALILFLSLVSLMFGAKILLHSFCDYFDLRLSSTSWKWFVLYSGWITFWYFPVWYTLWLGQITCFIFFGLALLLSVEVGNFSEEQKVLAALLQGIGLLLTMMKAHVLALFYVVLFMQWLRKREHFKLVVCGLTLLLALLVPHLFYSDIYAHYLSVPHSAFLSWTTPNLSGLFSLDGYTKFIPLFVAVVIASYVEFFRGHESKRADVFSLMIALCASLLVSPYCWPYDYLILLPVCYYLSGYAVTSSRFSSWSHLARIAIFPALTLTAIVIAHFRVSGFIIVPLALIFLSLALRYLKPTIIHS